MHLGLENKVVLITGGTKGIGRSMVKAFLSEGATVHFCSRKQSDIDTANTSLAKLYPSATAHGSVVDVSDHAAITSWVSACASQSHKIDVVVANVSSFSTKDNVEEWTTGLHVDVQGTWTLLNASIPHLEKTRGNIVVIGSVSGRELDFTSPGPYGAIKSLLAHYVAALATQLAPKGVRANTCSPGNIYIEDGVWGDIEREQGEFFKEQMARNPMGRMGKAEEIADAVLFLASERASFVSGINFVVDGALCNGVQM